MTSHSAFHAVTRKRPIRRPTKPTPSPVEEEKSGAKLRDKDDTAKPSWMQ